MSSWLEFGVVAVLCVLAAGGRPHAYGDVWDAMTLRERRWAFWSDILVGSLGAGLIYLLGGWLVP
jgi:hypothetical protein